MMDSQEIRTLKLLEAIEKDQIASQRDMARRLNVSLGLVNSFLKRLAHKGYFKITHIPKNRLRYILTPMGAAEKTRLTYLYIQHSLGFYKTARQRLRTLFQNLTGQGVDAIVFYGASDLTEIAYLSLQETTIRLAGVVDDDRAGERFIWGEVMAEVELAELTYDRLLITVLEHCDDIAETLQKKGIPQDRIVMIESTTRG